MREGMSKRLAGGSGNGIGMSISSLTVFFNSLFLFFIVILPSGNIFGVNVKILSIMAMIFFNSIFLFKKRKLKKRSIMCFFITFLSVFFVFCFYFIGVMNGNLPDHVNSETTLFLTFFISCMFLYISVVEGSIKSEQVLKTIIYGSIFYSLIKIVLILLFAFKVIPISVVVLYLQENHGVYPMMLQITSNITRFQLANDFIMCFLLYLMIVKSSCFLFMSRNFFIITFVVLTVSVITSFSRYMFIVIFLAAIIKFLFMGRITSKGMIYFVGVFLLSIIITFSTFDEISNAIDTRFNSSATVTSDRTRDLQFDCLSRAVFESPIYGNGGMGAYNKSCPGPDGDEYSYEVQYLGFAYKFGFLLTAFFLFIYSYQLIGSYEGRFFSRRNISVSIGLFSWLCIGMFNPYLVSAYASVIMTMFFCCLDRR
ncbi:hypothetical protein [Pectobacterium carotovorum]|uniref:hypothetical protein n=1 Tax=Pectobacterium carotovorum TaxID=554 RepID=UPI00057F3754|nr:hypothetical protein [Pectobacterium carotovorum]KHT14082.1 hypothetical protein RC96_17590 [Pectobacterium carotovorum subsp. carotovorum]MBB1527435.1 hypothetical protein [Pectobacterium carotovorum subsp. carotovorum]MCA6965373.1 hypothetical protein [Pectobacterium carotovorum]MCH4987797.1 hypothetical protein [Pectobacterium carotovorum]